MLIVAVSIATLMVLLWIAIMYKVTILRKKQAIEAAEADEEAERKKQEMQSMFETVFHPKVCFLINVRCEKLLKVFLSSGELSRCI